MLYEIKLKTAKTGDDGFLKEVKEHYITDAELHADAESIGYGLYPNAETDVFAVFRSDIKEIVNEKEDGKDFYKATVIDTYTDETSGKEKEKEMKYRMLVCAGDIAEATAIMTQYLKQGYDMRLDGIKRVKILDYIQNKG